jgi:hypothetical protein
VLHSALASFCSWGLCQSSLQTWQCLCQVLTGFSYCTLHIKCVSFLVKLQTFQVFLICLWLPVLTINLTKAAGNTHAIIWMLGYLDIPSSSLLPLNSASHKVSGHEQNARALLPIWSEVSMEFSLCVPILGFWAPITITREALRAAFHDFPILNLQTFSNSSQKTLLKSPQSLSWIATAMSPLLWYQFSVSSDFCQYDKYLKETIQRRKD